MSMKKEFTCNSCGKTAVDHAPNWLFLSQPEKSCKDDVAKLEKDQCFCNLKCLLAWTQRAVKEEDTMKEVAKIIYPRGRIISDEKGMEYLYL